MSTLKKKSSEAKGNAQKVLTSYYNVSPEKNKKRKQVNDDTTSKKDPCKLLTTKKPRAMKGDNKEISSRSTLSDLREIALSRGYEETSLPNTKADLKALLLLDEPLTTNPSKSVKNKTITTKTIITTIKEQVIKVENCKAVPKSAPVPAKSTTTTAMSTTTSRSTDKTKIPNDLKKAENGKKWSMKSSLEELQDEAFLRNLPFDKKKKAELLELLNGDIQSSRENVKQKGTSESSDSKSGLTNSKTAKLSNKKTALEKPSSPKTLKKSGKAKSTAPAAVQNSENESRNIKVEVSAESSKPIPAASCSEVKLIENKNSKTFKTSAVSIPPQPEPVISKPQANKVNNLFKVKSEEISSVSCEANFRDTSTEQLSRISNKLSMAELQEEAVCRGFTKKELPKNKADLLHFLLDGSILLKETKAWKELTKIKNQMELEKEDLYQKSLQNKIAQEWKKADQQKAKMEKLAGEKERIRREEKASQKKLHAHSFPRVHAHLLAKTCELVVNSVPRNEVARCSKCETYDFCYTSSKVCIYTCEECDFDICYTCFGEENRTDKEKRKAAELDRLQRTTQEKKWREQQALLKEKYREQEEEEELRWDASKQFSKQIIHPPEKNKKPDGNGMNGFTVWCSDGYEPDRWHCYMGEPRKEFDSTWKTANEANERARYLFFWKNSWGIGPDEVDEPDEDLSEEGLKTYTVKPDDSTRWTVSVVPDHAFKYLDHATMCRHNFDDEREPETASNMRGFSSYF